MHRDVSRYDRILISMAMAVLGAVVMTGAARAQPAGAPEPMLDRYGGMTPAPLQPAPSRAAPARAGAPRLGLRGPIAAPRAFAGRTLSWAGKTYDAPPAPAYAQAAPREAAPFWRAPLAAAPPAYAAPERRRYAHSARHRRREAAPTFASAPQQDMPAPSAAPAQAYAVQPPRPLPASIYAPAPVAAARAAPPPVQSAPAPRPVAVASVPPRAGQAVGNSSVRHYSVHREFGIQPDPTPIPPQFFTATADLSEGDADVAPLARTTPAQAASSKTGRGRVAAPVANPS